MGKGKKGYRLGFEKRDERERSFIDDLEKGYSESGLTDIEKLMNFSMYVPRQDIATFIYKYELFKRVVNVHGSIVECGVAFGGGLMAFAQFSAIFEEVNYTRKIIGFDTFAGFPHLSSKDSGSSSGHSRVGGMAVDSFKELEKCIGLYNRNRFLGHINKVELVKGDVMKTIPKYIKDNPSLVVSLLYLDFDLYEATKVALKYFLPRMPKGAVIAFDEVGHPDWPGETQAVIDAIGLNNLRLERCTFDTTRSFAVLE
ncbi:MAG: class I SAM-dependent methyltransferase [Nitrospirae bacterium]|nr:class I SAM-dependent methyltransferase [Nitrospirota bacterium]